MGDPLDLCRAANVALFIFCLVGYFVRSNDRWADYSFGVKLKRIGIGAVFSVIAVGSANAYVHSIPPTWVTPCATVAGAMVLVGLWLSRVHHDGH
jgi:hypothetical protein